jgi:hypothetical protein
MLVLGVLRAVEDAVGLVDNIVNCVEDTIDRADAGIRHRPQIYPIRNYEAPFALYLLSVSNGLNICESVSAVSLHPTMTSTNTMSSKAKRKVTQAEKKTEVPGDPEAPEAPDLPKTDGWLTRNEASDVLRCSPQTLKNYESRNLLHPAHAVRRDSRGSERVMLVFNPKELTALPYRNSGGQPKIEMREPGEQAARAFELFRQGCALDEIVIELRETPDRIDHLYEHWLDQTKARLMITPEAKKAFEQIVGAFTDVAGLIELTKKLAPS